MDADLVEKITRLVLLRLGEHSERSVVKGWNNHSFAVDERVEYLPLTNDDIKEWTKITSTARFSKKVDEIPPHFVPLTVEELKSWNNLSASMRVKVSEQADVREQTNTVPLTDQELNSWRNLDVNNASLPTKEQGHCRVKFFRHHE